MPVTPETSAATRQRLLQAAGEIFAEQGFRQATVRDICKKAEANVAAVNYHFRDKVGLYAAVLKHWFGAAAEQYPSDGGLPPSASAEERLGAFVRSFLFRILGQGTPAWHGQLMAREMSDPVPGVIDAVVENHIRPQSRLLFQIICELIGPKASDETIRRCGFSVIGQCVFYRLCHNIITRLHPTQDYRDAEIEQIARHVFRVVLAGVYSYRDEPAQDAKPAKSRRDKTERR